MARERDAGSEPQIRQATAEDAEGIYGLTEELALAVADTHPEPEAVRERLAELLEEPRARVVVVEGESGLVGAASLWIKPDLAHGDTVIEVPMLVVTESSRYKGVGKRLIAEVRKIAAENGATLIELVATRENRTAQAFYRSLGFVDADLVSLEFLGDMKPLPDNKG
ncbi:MAG: GNAT family N-acetyltransferase [Rubrobacteraceae bacterium]